jgi:hypothetical protein
MTSKDNYSRPMTRREIEAIRAIKATKENQHLRPKFVSRVDIFMFLPGLSLLLR